MTEENEVRFESKRIDQLAGEVRNWLLDRRKDVQDSRPWDQRPSEDQEMAISQCEAFAVNLVADIAEALEEHSTEPIRAILGKVTTDGKTLKADVSLNVDDGDEDVHAMVDAAGKKVLIIVSDPDGYSGLADRPQVAADQGSLGLEQTGDEEFDRVYLASATRELADENLPNDDWLHGECGEAAGAVWQKSEPTPSKDQPYSIEAKRSVDRNEEGNVIALGGFEPPEVVAEFVEEALYERVYTRAVTEVIPATHKPSNKWLFGMGGVAAGREWFIESEKPEPTADEPVILVAKRELEKELTQGEKVKASWQPAEVHERYAPSEGTEGDDAKE